MLEILKQAHDQKQVEMRVEEWGKWTRYQSGVRGPLSPLAALMRDNTGTVLSAAPLISDDEAECIGQAVLMLSRVDPVIGSAIKIYFCSRINNVRDLGREMHVSKDRAADALREGLKWLWGYFYGLAILCENN